LAGLGDTGGADIQQLVEDGVEQQAAVVVGQTFVFVVAGSGFSPVLSEAEVGEGGEEGAGVAGCGEGYA
jgi:hypothetical protein